MAEGETNIQPELNSDEVQKPPPTYLDFYIRALCTLAPAWAISPPTDEKQFISYLSAILLPELLVRGRPPIPDNGQMTKSEIDEFSNALRKHRLDITKYKLLLANIFILVTIAFPHLDQIEIFQGLPDLLGLNATENPDEEEKVYVPLEEYYGNPDKVIPISLNPPTSSVITFYASPARGASIPSNGSMQVGIEGWGGSGNDESVGAGGFDGNGTDFTTEERNSEAFSKPIATLRPDDGVSVYGYWYRAIVGSFQGPVPQIGNNNSGDYEILDLPGPNEDVPGIIVEMPIQATGYNQIYPFTRQGYELVDAYLQVFVPSIDEPVNVPLIAYYDGRNYMLSIDQNDENYSKALIAGEGTVIYRIEYSSYDANGRDSYPFDFSAIGLNLDDLSPEVMEVVQSLAEMSGNDPEAIISTVRALLNEKIYSLDAPNNLSQSAAEFLNQQIPLQASYCQPSNITALLLVEAIRLELGITDDMMITYVTGALNQNDNVIIGGELHAWIEYLGEIYDSTPTMPGAEDEFTILLRKALSEAHDGEEVSKKIVDNLIAKAVERAERVGEILPGMTDAISIDKLMEQEKEAAAKRGEGSAKSFYEKLFKERSQRDILVIGIIALGLTVLTSIVTSGMKKQDENEEKQDENASPTGDDKFTGTEVTKSYKPENIAPAQIGKDNPSQTNNRNINPRHIEASINNIACLINKYPKIFSQVVYETYGDPEKSYEYDFNNSQAPRITSVLDAMTNIQYGIFRTKHTIKNVESVLKTIPTLDRIKFYIYLRILKSNGVGSHNYQNYMSEEQ